MRSGSEMTRPIVGIGSQTCGPRSALGQERRDGLATCDELGLLGRCPATRSAGARSRNDSLPSFARTAESCLSMSARALRCRAASASRSIRPSRGRMISTSPETTTALLGGRSAVGDDRHRGGAGQASDEGLALAEGLGGRPARHEDRRDLGGGRARSARRGGCAAPRSSRCQLGDDRPRPRDRAGLRDTPARGRCRRSRRRARASGRPRTGATSASACQTCSVTNGMIGWRRRQRPSRTAARTRWATGRVVGVAEPALEELDVPVAEVVPGEVAEPPGRLGELEALQVGRHVGGRPRQQAQDPAVLDRQRRPGRPARARSLPGSSGRTARRSRTCSGRSGPARTARRC